MSVSYLSNMEPFNSVFEYVPKHRMVICKAHRQGVVKLQFRSHLDSKHKEWAAQTRQHIAHAASGF